MSQPLGFAKSSVKQSQGVNDVTLKLPEELWRQIFWQASVTPGVDEFSQDPAFHFNNLQMGDMGTSFIRRSELRVAVQCRLNLVLVCRSWAMSGMSVLWSHLCLELRNPASILHTLQQRAELRAYVRRITPSEAELSFHLQPIDDVGGTLQSIVNLCTNLHTLQLQVPTTAQFAVPESVKHVHLYLRSGWRTFPNLPNGITSLRLSVQNKPFWMDPLLPVEFPALQSLDLLEVNHSDWVDEIMNSWTLPSLQMLVLPGGPKGSRIIQLLQRYGATVAIVRMPRVIVTDISNETPLQVPQLTHLYVTPYIDTIRYLRRVPALSHLKVIATYWPFPMGIADQSGERSIATSNFHTFLSDLNAWASPNATIRLFGRHEYHQWLFHQPEISDLLSSIRNLGRRVEHETREGVIIEIEPNSQ